MPFHFTELCRFHMAGKCTRGGSCTFAHSKDVLKKKPDLSKTRLCVAYMESGWCEHGINCTYAHSVQELRHRSTKASRHHEGPTTATIFEQFQNLSEVMVQNDALTMRLLRRQHELTALQLSQKYEPTPCTFGDHWDKLSQSSEGEVSEGKESEIATTPASSLPAFSHRPSDASILSDAPVEDSGRSYLFQERPDFWQGHGVFVKNTFIEPLRNTEPCMRRSNSAPPVVRP
eukprot:TRINITY_DN13662_c0_g1_i1.p1 TRINITY_DN13662_c0_g1~~TRINITY_DN13662_c0_g1_i1.p1  ORF type:complete len:231 (-),score=29.46 TRINITY_DN13662_c0_g1_i1:21-713(-)